MLCLAQDTALLCNWHYHEVEVYQALLSIALIHVQVMLNICTTVSSATRATRGGKKSPSSVFRRADLLQHFTDFKNITKSAACTHNISKDKMKTWVVGLYKIRTFKLKDVTSESRPLLSELRPTVRIFFMKFQFTGCNIGMTQRLDSVSLVFKCVNQEQKRMRALTWSKPQVKDGFEHSDRRGSPSFNPLLWGQLHVSRLKFVPSSADP